MTSHFGWQAVYSQSVAQSIIISALIQWIDYTKITDITASRLIIVNIMF